MSPRSSGNAAPVEILIAEDSATQAMLLQGILEKHGFHVTAARDGRLAWESLAQHRPHIVITDIQMPEMDGYELCRRIKADSALQDIPVILLTSLSDARDILHGIECGADNFIVKPYDEEFLLSRIRQIIENQKLARESEDVDGIPIFFAGERVVLPSQPVRMIGLLVSTYETAVQKNLALHEANAALEEKAQELARSNSELERFGYVVSHDLQEPLRTVTGFLQLLEKRFNDALGKDGSEFIQLAVDGAGRMKRLISDLLEYSRVGTRGKPLSPCDCGTVIGLALNNLHNAISESGAEVTHDALPVVMGDEIQLTQLFQNLIGNAIKFRRPGEAPRVHVGLKQDGAMWQFSVRDHGIGIDPSQFERIFEIFQRLHARSEYEGTGIGLAVCKKIVERHGGRIWVEPGEGGGSTFCFTIPEAAPATVHSDPR